MWIKRSDGQPSASLTFSFIAFIVTTLWLLLSIFEKIGPLDIRPFNSSEAMAYLIPILALYFGRRLTEAKYITNGSNGKDKTIIND